MKLYNDKYEMIIEMKIKPNIKMIYDMKVQGLKDKYIAQALGITVKEFQDIKDKFELLKDTYDDAMHILTSKLTDIVVSRALGTDGKVNARGEEIGPDENLAFKLLEKLDKRFSSKQEIIQTVTIENIIRGLAEKSKKEIEGESDGKDV